MTYHVPVLLPQCIEGLRILPDGVYVDATMGGGGHTRAILERLGDRGVLFGFDQDASAAINVPDDERFHFVHGNFRFLKNYLRYYGFRHVNGILADLGVSSYQFDTPERGFTFRSPAALDMRMNSSSRLTAAEVVNTYDQEQLCRIFRDYGEIANAGRLAALIVRGRSESPIETSSRLTDLIAPCTPPHGEFKYWAKVFQALRIEVNHEMDSLRALLEQSADVIIPGGRLVVITYHSLEDRAVKRFIRDGRFSGQAEKDFYGNPLVPFKALGNKVITPDEKEIAQNPRARSAKLRIAVKN
ncbi:MAG: 16S rRNA (cytosine(1402)-N(4))-methyltransferase RsmH [Bacteroidales bacterium]|nr:16S rRNA (cytosine(1402)-N(4))-methyltransferase RsmH [Bacteroidales bacterium]